jgi:hypothetical protein
VSTEHPLLGAQARGAEYPVRRQYSLQGVETSGAPNFVDVFALFT